MTVATSPPPASAPFPPASTLASHWQLDPSVVYLNHGSFGATPTRVLAAQQAIRAIMESEAVRFFVEELQVRADECRRALAALVDCEWDSLALVTNATVGVATALENCPLGPGDEILVNDHEYPACLNNARRVAARAGATVVQVTLPWPLPAGCSGAEGESLLAAAILAGVTPRTRIALLSHVTSPSGLVLPLTRIVPELRARGVRSLIDGAHAPGMLDSLSLRHLDCDYYTANCHKWVCSPKGSAFLYVRPALQSDFRPLVLSNNAQAPKPGRAQFLTEFDFTGTSDPSAILAIPDAICALEEIGLSLRPQQTSPRETATAGCTAQSKGLAASVTSGPSHIASESQVAPHLARQFPGFAALMQHNRALCLGARRKIVEAMGIPAVAPENLVGTIASILIPLQGPHAQQSQRPLHRRYADPLQERLLDRWRIQVPIWWVPGTTQRLVRISAQAYNTDEQYDYLTQALRVELHAEHATA